MKYFFSILAAFALIAGVHAQNQQNPAPAKAEKTAGQYEFFSLAFAPGVSTSPDYVDVYGVRIGAPISFGEESFVAGAELAVIAAMTARVYGVQSAFIFTSAAQGVDGLQFSIVNSAGTVNGLQLGIVNLAKDTAFQIGLINYIENSKLPFFPIVNVRF